MPGNGGSRLAFDNRASAAQVVTTATTTASVTPVMLLHSSLLANIVADSSLYLGRLIEVGGVRAVTKRGAGIAYLNEANGYTGVTRVQRGWLYPFNPGGGTFLADVEIGTGVASSEAVLAAGVANQFQPTATIDVRAGGVARITEAQRIRHLRVTDGLVLMGGSLNFVADELAMVAGAIEAHRTFAFPRAVTATSSASGPAMLRPNPFEAAGSTIDIGQMTTIVVNDGPNATVPATSRYNVDVRSSVPELRGTAFGARVDVTNAVPIAVERSLYWNAGGAFWAGGSNALATPLP